MAEDEDEEGASFCNTSIPFKNASSSITTTTFGTCEGGGGMRVRLPVCVCCSDINRFSFVVPFDSHSGWGRQINDDGNIYDIATATGGAYNEWVMQHTSSIDQRGSGAVGPAGTRHHRQSIRHAVPVAELLRSY